jgi:hypothetical protein
MVLDRKSCHKSSYALVISGQRRAVVHAQLGSLIISRRTLAPLAPLPSTKMGVQSPSFYGADDTANSL